MKALTLWQPWASLIACGAKKIETRSWATKYRGPIAIHAAAIPINKVFKMQFPVGAKGWTYHPEYAAMQRLIKMAESALCIDDICKAKLPLGEIVALIEQTDCIKMTDEWIGNLSQQELAFGWFDVGRYGHIYENVRQIDPIPAVGHQGLWNWELPDEVKKMPGV